MKTIYRTDKGIENAVKRGETVIRTEDNLYSAMCSLAAYSDGCVDTFTVKAVFLGSGLVFDVSIQKMLPNSQTQQTSPENVLAEETDYFSPDYKATALKLYPNYISFGCGHKIEATVSDIEGLDDGTDLSLCPTCKRTQEK